MKADLTLSDVLTHYSGHAEFEGCTLTDANARGADNSILNVAAFRGNLTHVRVLVENGANVHFKGDMGYTPLHDAVSAGHGSVAAYLLDHGADPNTRNEFGQTALEMASQANDKTMLRLLKSKSRR